MSLIAYKHIFIFCCRVGSTKALVVKYMFWLGIQDLLYSNSSMLKIYLRATEESLSGSTATTPTLTMILNS